MATQNFQHLHFETYRVYGGDYSTVRNATTGVLFEGKYIGQWYHVSIGYRIFRTYLIFDTSGLEDDALIISAKLTLRCNNNRSFKDFNIIITNGQPTYPHHPIEAGDYDISHYSGNGGEINTSDVPDAGSFVINFNSIGIDWINVGGETKLALISFDDATSEPPTTEEYISLDLATYPPVLTVEYFLPTEAPTVTTINEACEDRQATTLTAVGNITGSGDGYTFRGFEYYQYDSEYDSSMWAVREIGRFVTPCIYRMTLSGLKPSTIYWIRAYAGNVFGTSYGDWVICCTIAGSPSTYDVYTEPNTARYRLYVSDDEAIAWRGYKGPYSGKQTLINISDITNKTKGVKVLKIDLPDANTKGNFHICITVKQTLKG